MQAHILRARQKTHCLLHQSLDNGSRHRQSPLVELA